MQGLYMPQVQTHPAISPSAQATLENLALRFRGAGLMLALSDPQGQILWHDPAAATFFHRYALPLLKFPQLPQLTPPPPPPPSGPAVRQAADAAVMVRALPGVLVCAAPHLEKRKVDGILLLVCRGEKFSLDEDVLRICSQLGLDGQWLLRQALDLPSYGPDALLRQGRLCQGMWSDRLALESMHQELDSLSNQLANTYEELSLVYQISGGMRVNRRPSEFFQQACLDVLEVMGVGGMGVALNSSNSQHQQPVIYGSLALPPGSVQRLAAQLIGELAARPAPLLLNDLAANETYRWLTPAAAQLIAVPLLRGDAAVGCLFALNKKSGEFDSVDLKLLNAIANQASIHLDNARLFDDLHELMMGLLHALTSAVDAKDAYTCGHSERVAQIARLLAIKAGCSEYDAQRTYMAGLLHDLGKIGVPEEVLCKTGKLTAEEFDLMKKHPQVGARILRDIKQIEDIIPGVMHHHERFDGNGYPAGLSGENIPLKGRIICLADCFDAMTSNRTYRKAIPVEVALMEIRRCSGTQFDPKLADILLSLGQQTFRDLMQQDTERARGLADLQNALRHI